MLHKMSLTKELESLGLVSERTKGNRSRSAQGLSTAICSPAIKIPLPPRLWITDVEDESSDDSQSSNEAINMDRSRVRSRYRHYKHKPVSVPIGIFWDIENCQVPRGCSAMDVVAAIRAKFLPGRREADFVVVCDARKESVNRLQELNDAQVSLIHVCGTQKNAADEKLRQCMRRFGELHSAPAALCLISGDINFAADLSDLRHRKNMEVILVHKQNTSTALIACATVHYCFNQLTAELPRNPKVSQSTDEEEPTCELEVCNLPLEHTPEKISRRLRRLADNCGGKVLRVIGSTAVVRFPTVDQASRALKRMDREDVFGSKITTRFARSPPQPTYSSDEGYSTAPANGSINKGGYMSSGQPICSSPREASQGLQFMSGVGLEDVPKTNGSALDWARALQQLPTPTAPPHQFCPPPAPRLRKITGAHGSVNLDRSACSSNSGDDSRHELNHSRAASPWNYSSFSEQSDGDTETVELSVTNLPSYETMKLQLMLMDLFTQYVPVIRISVWMAGEGPVASVTLRSEADARVIIARIHKRRLKNEWHNRRLELSFGKPSPIPSLDVLRARLKAILLDQPGFMLPVVRLRDAYASRYCCALTTSDLSRVPETVIMHSDNARMVQLIDLTPPTSSDMEEASWKCNIHASLNIGQEDGSRILQPVYIEISALARNVEMLLQGHGGILPLMSFVECYESAFLPFTYDAANGVCLELLLRSLSRVEVQELPSRHLTWAKEHSSQQSQQRASPSNTSRSDSFRCYDRPRTAPALEPMLALLERELVDLLRTMPRCTLQFSKLIPLFHHHFGRQCRVADYGFTKLPDLLSVLGNTVVVMGSGSSRVVTLSPSAQSRRWTSDLVKILKTQTGRSVTCHDIPQLYQATFRQTFSPADYGVCYFAELMARMNTSSVLSGPDGTLSLPRGPPSQQEKERIKQFSSEAIELLSYTANFRMDFNGFVPAYHAHFGRQLRVANYGCVKLLELLEEAQGLCVTWAADGTRWIRAEPSITRQLLASRLGRMAPLPLTALPHSYAVRFGDIPKVDMLEATTIEHLIYLAGGCIEDGNLLCGPSAINYVTGVLIACAALCADRSIARGSTKEYLMSSCQYRTDINVDNLALAGVIRKSDGRIHLQPAWRVVLRIARLLTDSIAPIDTQTIFQCYSEMYKDGFLDLLSDVAGLSKFLEHYCEVFEHAGGEVWRVRSGVNVPRASTLPLEDYSHLNTPPGHKGSRVFESPKTNLCSPPPSALPMPSTWLVPDNKRRVRLAAQFERS